MMNSYDEQTLIFQGRLLDDCHLGGQYHLLSQCRTGVPTRTPPLLILSIFLLYNILEIYIPYTDTPILHKVSSILIHLLAL